MRVHIHQQEVKLTLKSRQRLKRFIPLIFKKEKTGLDSLEIIFCSDEFLLGMNRQFLDHDYYTDIITFNLAKRKSPVVGELYISVDRVRDNAATINTSFSSEIHRVIFHGCLHLCGYGDKTGKEKFKMRDKENYYLSHYL